MVAKMASRPEVYWAMYALSIDNVGDKFTNQVMVTSKPFRCERDPKPNFFVMRLGFGVHDGKETWLSANIRNITEDVTYRYCIN